MSKVLDVQFGGDVGPSSQGGKIPPVERLRRHIETRIRGATLDLFPFPHLIIRDFFPASVYKAVLDYNLFRRNEGVEWFTRSEMEKLITPTPYDHRMQINFHKNEPFEASDAERRFWAFMRQVFLGGDWFPRLIYHKFPTYFDLRFGEAVHMPDMWQRLRTELFLQRHEPNYHIGPHTDIPTRIFTCIFSFADRPGFEDYGTQLLRHRDPYVRCWGRQHYDFDDFEVVKTAPYAPNSFLLFFKTRQSFHSVKTVTPDVPNGRYGMQYQLYEPGIGLFRDLSHPDLLAAKHRKDGL